MKEKYGIVWVQGKDLYTTIPDKYRAILFGICGRSKRVCRTAVSVESTFNKVDFSVEDDKCEMAEACADVSCELNEATWESYMKSNGLEAEPGKDDDAAQAFESGRPATFNSDGLGNLHDMSAWVKDPSMGGYLIKTEDMKDVPPEVPEEES